LKILFFTGKGGVGKSTNSALFAVQLAKAGYTVLLNSIDPAHNLKDIFECRLGMEPKEIMDGLKVMETDLSVWVKKYLRDTEKNFKEVYKYQKAFNLQKYFTTLKYSPGLEEYAVLLALNDTISRFKELDFIIFDTPPTALTLKFLALPDVSILWLKELSKFRQSILDKKEIITKIKQGGRKKKEVEKDPVLSKLNSLVHRYDSLISLLKDPDMTKIIVVLNPDQLSFNESCTIIYELSDLKLKVSHIIVNKYRGQEKFTSEVSACFEDIPVVTLDLQDSEITGVKKLTEINIPINLASFK